MAVYAVCEQCKKLYEYRPEVSYEGGISYITVKCSECGHIKNTNTNHVHYGEDGKR